MKTRKSVSVGVSAKVDDSRVIVSVEDVDVRQLAGSIYGQVSTGNMPPGAPWSKDMAQTFLNWMSNGYKKGQPQALTGTANKAVMLAAARPAGRIRKYVEKLSDPEIATLKKAFQGIMDKDVNDPNSYFVQAGYHWLPVPTFCEHHAPGYNPWHRAYLYGFENALRSVPGCEEVTLPYWDITRPLPALLSETPFASYTLPQDIGESFNAGYVTQRNDPATITENLKNSGVFEDIPRAMATTDWEDFHGYWSNASNNTIIAVHDNGHNSTGSTMAEQSVAAFDPVFWFFHCNWDRLWWEWQKKMDATSVNGLLTTIEKDNDETSYQIFTVPALMTMNPFTALPGNGLKTVDTVDSVANLDVDYLSDGKGWTSVSKAAPLAPMDREVSVDSARATVRVSGVNRLKIPGSFNVHLFKDGERNATRGMFPPREVEKCENCVKNAIAHFDFDLPLQTVAGGKLHIEVEPLNKDFVGDRFPTKMLGKPTISVHLPVHTD